MTGPHERFSGGLNKTQLLKSNIQKDVYMAMMLYYGVLPGLLYLLLQIKACFKMTDNRCISAVILIITLIIINTEPHYMTLLFTTFFMYFARKIENKKAYEIQFEG